MSAESLVTVVIPAHRCDAGLLALMADLDGQAREEGTLDVVVSDDGAPTPVTDSLAAPQFGHLALRVVRSDTPAGPGAARNRALAEVRTPWTAFLDADERLSRGWLRRLRASASASDAPDVLAGRVQTDRGASTPFSHATEIAATQGEHGCGNLAVRTEALRAVNGFDERYFDLARRLHFREDIDLYFRLTAAGYTTRYEPDWVVHHPPLPADFWSPVRLARRYYFDPLLAREHGEPFVRSLRARRVGPFPLRWARHHAALAHAVGSILLATGLLTGRRRLRAAAAVAFGAAWAANAAALSWRRTVPLRIVPALLAASFLTPWVYLWSFYRGVVAFRHRPRLR